MNFNVLCIIAFFTSFLMAVEARTWTSQDGRTVEGEWVFSDDTQITLKLKNGREVIIPLSKLSDADQAYAKKKAGENFHPAGWRKLRVVLDHIEAGPRAIGMPGAFHRVNANTWEAHLPLHCWIGVRDAGGTEHLLKWSGKSGWAMETDGIFLYRKTTSDRERKLVGVSFDLARNYKNFSRKDKEAYQRELSKLKNVESVGALPTHLNEEGQKLLKRLNPSSVSVQVTARMKLNHITSLSRLRALHFHLGEMEDYSFMHQLRSLECFDAGSVFSRRLKKASDLVPLPKVKFLSISRLGSDCEIKGFSQWKSLEALHVSTVTKKVPMEFASLPKLYSLSGMFGTVEVLDKFSNLIRMGCPISPAKPLPNLKKITYLKYSDTKTLNAWRATGGLKHLRKIGNLSGHPAKLKGFEGLRHITVSAYGKQSVAGLGDALQLETLRLNSRIDGILPYIQAQKNLKGLYVKFGFTSSEETTDMTKLKLPDSLRCLGIQQCEEMTSLKGVEAAKNLEFLSISSADKLEKLTGLGSLNQLTGIKLTTSHQLKILGVGGLKELQWIHLNNLSKLPSIENLESAKNLKSLKVYHCRSLTDLSGLKNLSQLRWLSLRWVHSKASPMEAILQLKSLEFFIYSGLSLPRELTTKLHTKKGELMIEQVKQANQARR